MAAPTTTVDGPARGRVFGWRRWRNRLVLSAFGLAAGAVLAEIGLRTFEWLTQGDELLAWRRRSADAFALTDGRTVLLGQMVRPAQDPDIVYELLPDLNVEFQRHAVRTGSRGFRGGDPPPDHRAGDYRIVGIGDSVMFGSGVAAEDTFLAQLGTSLQKTHPEHRVIAVNTGVPGYNTTMEVATLATKCLDLEPDLVIVDWVENDFDLPNFLLLPPDPLRLDRSVLYELAYRALRKGRRPNGPLEPAPMADKHFFESDPARVPAAYRHMIGPDGYRRALERLVALGAQHHFHVLVTCHTGIDAPAAAICSDLHLPVVTAAERQRQWLAEHDQTLLASELVVAPDDRHPSAIGHRLLADEICAWVEQHHWLD